MNDIYRTHPWFHFFSVFLMLCCHGCLFGDKKEEKPVVYPITTMAKPQKGLEKKAEERPSKQERQQRMFRREMDKRFKEFSLETIETQQDILARIIGLEEEYQKIKEKILLVEFFQEETSGEIVKMQEELEAELDTLKMQLDDYNTLLIKILDKISSAPASTVQPQKEPAPTKKPEGGVLDF